MKGAFYVGLVASLLIGCGNNECEDAKEKAEDCGGTAAEQSKQISDDEASECNAENECLAKCVNNASCAEINSASLDSDFVRCVVACG